MKVRMREDKKASPDGVEIIDYKKGKTYEMPDELARAFVEQKLAIALGTFKPLETKVEEPSETKVEAPPEEKKKK